MASDAGPAVPDGNIVADGSPVRRAIGDAWSAARRVRVADVRRRYPSWLGWPLAALLLLIAGLILPWFAIPLLPDRSAWSMPLVLAGVHVVTWISYGAALTASLCFGLLAIAGSRGRASAATAAAGGVVLVVSLSFCVASVTADWPLLQSLQDQTADQAAIFSQFGYAVPGQAPSVMLLVPVSGSWALVAGALRLGWFCAVAGGLILFWSGAPVLARRARRYAMLFPALALLVVVAVLGRGAIADYLVGQGAAAVQSGDYPAAQARLSDASRLNPLLASSAAFEVELGQAQTASGGEHQPLAMLADAVARGAVGDSAGQVTELRQAVRLDPANSVLGQQLDQASQALGLAGETVGPLQTLSDPTVADVYTEGRIRYTQTDYPAAMPFFRQVIAMTRDGNVISSAYTYIALSEMKLGQPVQARLELLRAVSADISYNNTLARSLLVGLYTSTKSGQA